MAAIKKFFTQLFGQFTWTSPLWLQSLREKIKANKRKFNIGAGVFILLIISIAAGYYWYQSLPKPLLIQANINIPPVTPVVDKKLQPQPLTINFTKAGIPQSVAPLDKVGKPVSEGITTTPALQGEWRWQSDNQLLFKPAKDWPAQQTYHIKFDKNLFAEKTRLEKYAYSFTTLPFEITISELKFYQDLTHPHLQKIVGAVQFNFPVDPDSLAKNTQLILQEIKNDQLNLAAQKYPLGFTYDENKRTAYIQSEPINLPPVPRFMELVIDKGVQAAQGPGQSRQMVKQEVLVPDSDSFLQIKQIDAAIVRDNNDNPEQVINIETTLGVDNAELEKYVRVYALPQDKPATRWQPAQEDYPWRNPGEVDTKVLAQSTPVKLQAIPAAHPYPTLHSFKLKAHTPSFLYIKINKGVNGLGDFRLAQDYASIVPAPDFPQEINFLHKGALMALGGEKKLTVSVRGIPLVKFSIYRVLPKEINHLVSQTYGDYQDPKFLNYTFNADDISEVFTEKKSFNIIEPDQLQYATLDLAQYLNASPNSGLGLFLLKAQAWHPEEDRPTGAENNRLILITDMGLLVKDNADGSHNVFVQSITQGAPVADAEVAILGKNGLPIATARTDAQGHAHLSSVRDFKNEQEPIVYLVRKANDTSFIPYQRGDRRLNYSRFDVGGEQIDSNAKNLSAYLFSDRGIYRPGDKIHFGAIVKSAFSQPQPAGLPVEAIITDPRGMTVLDQKIALPPEGFFSLDYRPDVTAPTGGYTISVYLIKDDKKDAWLNAITVNVEEFLPDRLKMRAQLVPPAYADKTPAGWLSPQDLKAKINLWNLFGAPASERRVSAKIVLVPSALKFKEYPDYQFVDPLLDPKKPPKYFTENLTQAKTNQQGEAEFNLNLARFAKASYQLSFIAEGFEADGGRAVSAQTSALVTPLDYLVGYKPDGDLNYLKQNSRRTVNFIAINPALKTIALNDLRMQLLSVKTISTLVKKPNGTYAYESVQQEMPVSAQPFSINKNGADFALDTKTIGDYALVVLDKNANPLSKLYFSVVGQSSHPIPKNAELALKLDKKIYNPGDTIELQITAPYKGAGLITLERDGVYAYKWFKADQNNTVQSITIPADFKGNGYVNVAFVRAWDDANIYLSPLSYSIAPFSVNHAAQTIPVRLNVPELIQPGQTLSMQYATGKPGKIVVFAVDEGILQVADYTAPDPAAYFFRKQALTVDTAQIVDLILPKYIAEREISAVGGDGAARAMLAKNLNPFKRKAEKPVVFWSGIIDSDSTVRTLKFAVPDYFNGSLRVMAVAAANDATGSASKTALVRGDFVINPNAPTFVAPNDTFTISASVANNIKGSGKNTPTTLKLTASANIEMIGPAQQTIIIPEDQEKAVQFTVRAKKQLGNATLTITATQGDKTAQRAATLSVRPDSAYQMNLLTGYDKAAAKTIAIHRKLYPEYRLLQASASTNPLILALGLQSYLASFPYDCTEQLVSKAFAQLALAKQPFFNGNAQAAQQQLTKAIQILRQRQMSSGGFSYWPDGGDSYASKAATVYAMDLLTEASHEGYAVPRDVFGNGILYLQNFAQQDVDSLEEARLQAYAIYILTRNEIVTTSYLTNLLLYLDAHYKNSWREDLTGVYIAAAYQLLQNKEEAERLIKAYKFNRQTMLAPGDFYNSLIADAQYITVLARHFPALLPKVSATAVIALAQGLSGDQLNTLAAAYSIQALNAYAKAQPPAMTQPLSISEILADKSVRNLVSLNSGYQKVNFSAQAQQIQINNPAGALYFYQINQAGFNQALPTQPIKNNLEVFREYHDAADNVINKTALGDKITAHIGIRTLNNQMLNHVAIVDLLPGGFEVVPDSIQQANCEYADVREDRIIFYCRVTPDVLKIRYQLRATNKGDYIVPPIFAQAMYNQSVQAQGVAGKMAVD